MLRNKKVAISVRPVGPQCLILLNNKSISQLWLMETAVAHSIYMLQTWFFVKRLPKTTRFFWHKNQVCSRYIEGASAVSVRHVGRQCLILLNRKYISQPRLTEKNIAPSINILETWFTSQKMTHDSGNILTYEPGLYNVYWGSYSNFCEACWPLMPNFAKQNIYIKALTHRNISSSLNIHTSDLIHL